MFRTQIGRYQIVEELGRGAMGVVYRAFDPTIGRPVAIKTLLLDQNDPEAIKRFRREAQAAGVLSFPNIVTIYDAGEDEGVFYIAMELVEGETLQQLLARGPLPLDQAISITEEVAAALDYAHARQIFHRDIKPANIMIHPERSKVMDFGVARMGGTTLTSTGQALGTPSYMAPEIINGAAVDRRCDIFSLGGMLYEMLTGRKPFTGENLSAILYQILLVDPPLPTALNPALVPGLDFVILKALAKNPVERYQSGAELVADLKNDAILAGKGKAWSGPKASAIPVPTARIVLPDWKIPETERPARSFSTVGHSVRFRKELAIASSFLVLALTVGILWQRRDAPPPMTTQPEAQSTPVPQPSTPDDSTSPAQTIPSQQRPTPSAGTATAAPSPKPPPLALPERQSRPPAVNPSLSGRVVIHTKPQGAQISVNGETTPYRSPVNFPLPPGRYEITVERRGFASQSRQVIVQADQMIQLQIEMTPENSGRRFPRLPFP